MESIISAINTYGVFTVLIGFVLWGVYGIVQSRINVKEQREKVLNVLFGTEKKSRGIISKMNDMNVF